METIQVALWEAIVILNDDTNSFAYRSDTYASTLEEAKKYFTSIIESKHKLENIQKIREVNKTTYQGEEVKTAVKLFSKKLPASWTKCWRDAVIDDSLLAHLVFETYLPLKDDLSNKYFAARLYDGRTGLSIS